MAKEEIKEDRIRVLEEKKLLLISLLEQLFEEKKEEEGYLIEMGFENNPNLKKAGGDRIKKINNNIEDYKQQIANIDYEIQITIMNTNISIMEAKKLLLNEALKRLLEDKKDEEGYLIEMGFENNPNLKKAGEARMKEINENISQIELAISVLDEQIKAANKELAFNTKYFKEINNGTLVSGANPTERQFNY